MNIRDWFPKDIKSVVRVLVVLILLKVVLGFVSAKLPASVQPYVPTL